MGAGNSRINAVNSNDEERVAEIVGFTAKTLATHRRVPFGAFIVNSKTGECLLRAVNAL